MTAPSLYQLQQQWDDSARFAVLRRDARIERNRRDPLALLLPIAMLLLTALVAALSPGFGLTGGMEPQANISPVNIETSA